MPACAPKTRGADRDVLSDHLGGALAHDRPRRLEDQLARGAHTSADDDHVRPEGVGEREQPEAEPLAELAQHAQRRRVAGQRELGHLPPVGREACGGAVTGERTAGHERLEAAAAAAAGTARRPVRGEHDVAELGGRSVGAVEDVAVEGDRAADAGAESHDQRDVSAGGRAVAHLGEQRDVGVVVGHGRRPDALGDDRRDRHADDRQMGRGDDDAAGGVDQAGHAEADRVDLPVGLLAQLDDGVGDGGEQLLAPQAGDHALGASAHRERLIDERGLQVRATQIDADDAFGRHLRHYRRRSMAEGPDQERPRYTRYRATLRPPWHRAPDAEASLEQLHALNTGEPRIAARRGVLRRRRPPRKRPPWLRALRWALAALAAWIGVSVVLFVVSSLSAQGIPASAQAALQGGGLPPFSATNILVLGSDARPAGSKEPGADPGGPSRSDTMMLIRTGGGHSARLSIPRDTLVEHPRSRSREDQRRLLLRRPGARDPHRRAVPRHRGQPCAADQLHPLPPARRRDGRRELHRQLRRLADQRRFQGRRLHAAADQRHPPPRRRPGAGARANASQPVQPLRDGPHARAAPAEAAARHEEPDPVADRLHPPAVDLVGAAAGDRDGHGRGHARWRAELA